LLKNWDSKYQGSEMEKYFQKMKSILAMDSELNQIQDLDILLERILLQARNVTNADAGSIYLKHDKMLKIKFSQNDSLQKMLASGYKLIYNIFSIPINDKTLSGYVAHTGNCLNISDVSKIPEDAPYSFDSKYDSLSGYKTHSSLTVPLKMNTGELVGILQVINALDEKGNIIPFDEAYKPMIEHFAVNATVALQRARMTRAIILRMIAMSALRDPKETGPHVNRVAGYAVEIYDSYAKHKKIPQEEIARNIDNLRMAAMLHDVGKVAISDTILKKPGRFTAEEFEIMKGHTWQGFRLFQNRESELDNLAAEVALDHHENWDGSGYPGYIDIDKIDITETVTPKYGAGKKGKEISLFGRIVAIADVYDALGNKRFYKEAWAEENVLAEIKKMSGIKFDPELVDIFFEILPSIKMITSKYEE
jgi:HD-GYP domain-containing protein (c-di-GMP phosphodiesterase class II)